jgi:putative transposase
MKYKSRKDPQHALRIRLRDLAASRVRYGYRRLHVLLRREGWMINAKRVRRLYNLEGLSLRLKKPKKRVSALRVVPPPAQQPNERWSMDFMSDALHNGRRFRVFTIVDNFSRVSPALEVDVSLTGKRVVEVLERLKWTYGLPQVIHCDNGSEFISRAVDDWAHRNGVKLAFSRPAKPTDNPFIESFNGKLREECLKQHWFKDIEEARSVVEEWRREYNQQRPHRSLQGQTPEEFEERWRRKLGLKIAC